MAHIHQPTMNTEVCGQPMRCVQVEWEDASTTSSRWRIREYPDGSCAVAILRPPHYIDPKWWIFADDIEEAVHIAMKETK